MNKKNIENIYPLSPTQQGILFHTLNAPESGVYVVQSCYTFSQTLDITAFRQAWQQVIARHPILRTSFHWQQYKEPFQVVHKTLPLPWQYYDWQNSPEIEQQLTAFLQADAEQEFDLTHPPLLRLTLVQIAKNTYHFIWSSHHLILDGWSTALILQQVFQTYTGISDRAIATRPYADYINWLQQQNLAQAETFWRKTLKGFTAPTQLKLKKAASYSNQSLKLSKATTNALQSIARQHKLTLNTILQGAWAILLARYSSEQDIVFGATSSGRPPTLVGSESMVGLFINTLPVRVQVYGNELLIPWLQQLQARQVEAQQYEYSPLMQVQAWSDVPRDVPLFESILVFENYPVDASLQQWATQMQVHQIRSVESTNYAIALKAGVSTELSLEILSDRSSTTIERMLGHLQTLLEGIVANPQSAVASLPLLTAIEQQQLLDWHNTHNYPQDKSIQQLFAAQAAQTPDAIAVVCADQLLTYQQLNSRANQLARYLQKFHVGLEIPVAICLERSLEMVIGILAILKAGAAYVPIDPAYPQERLTAILADINAPVFLTQKRLLTNLAPINTKVVCLDVDWLDIQLESQENLPVAVTGDNLAYIMYTSGSTGIPKGVSVLNKGVVRLVKETNYAQLNAEDVFLQAAPISFDAATFEIWGCLLNGAKLVLFPNDTASLLTLGQVIRQHQITTLWLTASLFHLMVDEQLEDLQTVKQILAGGDVLSVPHVQKLLQSQSCQLINGYGPTENTTFSCCYQVTDDRYLENIPIGRAIANTQVYILDRHLQLVPIGVPGEIYVGGDGLARHYHNRPDLTASSFIPHPFSKTPGARLYKTGDLGCYREDGNIEFLGRCDRQVKIRGFRIELGEIEAAISQYPQLKQAVITANNEQLVAYIVLSPSLVEDLRCFLQSKLPKYMLPSVFVPLPALPLNVNGKIDRQLLPAPQLHFTQNLTYVLPRTTQEAQLAHLWSEILGVERVGIYDDFFALGGHSLALVRLFVRIKQTFGVDMPMKTIFTAPNIAEFAQKITSQNDPPPVLDFKAETVLDLEISCSDRKYTPITKPKSILLTGATGFLGAFLLAELLQQTEADIYCLVRAANPTAAKQKIQHSLASYLLNDEAQSSKIIPVMGDLSQPLLGLTEAQFAALAGKIDVIYHNGAWVHHTLPYATLKAANVLGTHEVLRLASKIKIKPVHFISTMSVFSAAGEAGLNLVGEDSRLDEIPVPEGGYAQSKWVAEKLVSIAGDRGLPISIYRPGRISGHSQTGAFNPNDLLYRLLIGCLHLGSFPEGELLEGLAPVDYISKAIVYLSKQPTSLGKAFHLFNPQPFAVEMLFKVIRSFGYSLQQISRESWQAELTKIADCFPEHPLYPLIPLLKNNKPLPTPIEFDCKNTFQELSNSSIICPLTDENLLAIYVSYLTRNKLVSLPQQV